MADIKKFAPTDEQNNALKKFNRGKSLKVAAYAGAGKTSTLQLLAGSNKSASLYVAFNKSIADEAATKFERHVECKTLHALALRSVVGLYGRDAIKPKLCTNPGARDVGDAFGLSSIYVLSKTGEERTMSARMLARMILDTVGRFCQSDDNSVLSRHVPAFSFVPMYDGYRDADSRASMPLDEYNRWKDVLYFGFRDLIASRANTLWARMCSPSDHMPLGHDGYLKVWALAGKALPHRVIYLDEAQDLTPVVLGMMRKQTRAQIVYVGDRWQQIYSWRGAIDAMTNSQVDEEARLTQSFRFGPRIAGFATRVLDLMGETVPVRGLDTINDEVVTDNERTRIIGRTNASVMEATIKGLQDGKSVHVIGGVSQLVAMVEDARDLMAKLPATRSALAEFVTWDDLVLASDEGDAEAHKIVDFVGKYDPGEAIDLLRRVSGSEGGADLTVTTAHKSKGREWETISLEDDFLPGQRNKGAQTTEKPVVAAEDVRLLYVAATRAVSSAAIPMRLTNMIDARGLIIN